MRERALGCSQVPGAPILQAALGLGVKATLPLTRWWWAALASTPRLRQVAPSLEVNGITQIRDPWRGGLHTPQEREGLGISDGVPVLDVLHTGIDQDGQPFEVTRFVMRADYTGLDYTMPVDH